jgi:DNA-binding PadR family transcriptional regulator
MYQSDIKRAGGRRGGSRQAILGLLAIGPMSGYDLHQLVEAGLAHFWRLSYGSIYPTLRRLTAEGLARRRAAPGRGGTKRFVYSLTAKGARLVDEWLARPSPDEPPIRSEFLLKVFLGARSGRGAVRAEIERFRDAQREVLARLSRAEDLISSEPDTEASFFWRLTLSRGKRVAQARMDWARDALAGLDARPEAAPAASRSAAGRPIRGARKTPARRRQRKEPS